MASIADNLCSKLKASLNPVHCVSCLLSFRAFILQVRIIYSSFNSTLLLVLIISSRVTLERNGSPIQIRAYYFDYHHHQAWCLPFPILWKEYPTNVW